MRVKESMRDLTEIRLDNSLNPETRVYLIARKLHTEDKINSDLWYAILDLKDKHIKDIQIDVDIPYFEKE